MNGAVAYLSMHTSPLEHPGFGHAGGMNVYVHELAGTMADRNVDVVVFTRRTSADQPEVVVHRPGYRVVHVDAGAPQHLPVDALAEHTGRFAEGVLSWLARSGVRAGVVHSHYWLSGWSGVLAKETLGVPLVNSFHTLGKVKDGARRPDEPPEPRLRTLTEDEVITRSDAIVASTAYERDDLVTHYGADARRIHVSPPGVDHIVFSPSDRATARAWLGLGEEPIVLFVGRIQAHKGIDIAIEATAKLPQRLAAGTGPPHLLVVGGPSGERGDAEARHLRHLAQHHGLAERVHFLDARPHAALADFYRAADVLVMPSRSESFGLVAAEAQSCGLPVVASSVGGLRHVVADGASGFVVGALEPGAFAEALVRVLDDPPSRSRLAAGAVAHAETFSWRSTARQLLELYAALGRR